ncbi:MAG: type II toxin-antitoxin system VapC family toxin [Acidobacteriota bacterium]|nr:type II toxin-antitoxin system VapC family toxin [Acidobacteriota bacterium]
MRVVLDANAAVEVALEGKAAGHLSAKLSDSEEVIAPELLFPEIVNAVWKYHQFAEFDLSRCEKVLELAVGLVDRFVSHRDIYREAFALSRIQQSRAAYDMFYLALALREDAVLLTLDATLKKEAKRAGIRVG